MQGKDTCFFNTMVQNALFFCAVLQYFRLRQFYCRYSSTKIADDFFEILNGFVVIVPKQNAVAYDQF